MTYQLSKTEQGVMRRALLRGTRSKRMYPYPQQNPLLLEINVLYERIRELENQRVRLFGLFAIVVGLLILFR